MRKLNNRERQEWRQLPIRIEALEEEQETLQAAMADAGFYQQHADEVKMAVERSRILPDDIDDAYTRWAELDERK